MGCCQKKVLSVTSNGLSSTKSEIVDLYEFIDPAPYNEESYIEGIAKSNKSKVLIYRTTFTQPTFKNANMLMKLTHPTILKCFYCSCADGYVYMVYEFIQNFEINRLDKRCCATHFNTLNLPELRNFALNALNALNSLHIHKDGIDEEDEIIILSDRHTFKLQGFHYAHACKASYKSLNKKYDGPYGDTTAPELLQNIIDSTTQYDRKVDIYALGCILYKLIVIDMPFICADFPQNYYDEQSIALKINTIMSEYEDKNSMFWTRLNSFRIEDLTDFISGMLDPNPAKRLDVTEALAHRWINTPHN
eukprot:gene14245-19116_t